MCNVKKILY